MNQDTLADWLRDKKITEIEGLVPDMTGMARGKIVPAGKYLREEGMRLPESILTQTVTGEYPKPELLDDTEGDMLLLPDVSTVRLVPWAAEPTAQLIHDCYDHDRNPVEIAPRHVLRRVLGLFEARGWQPVVAPEVEFFLVQTNTDPDYPLQPPVGRSGRPETVRQSYSIDAVNEFDPLFEQMYDYCEAQDIEIDTLIHEAGAAQMEVNFLHGDPLALADQVFLFKRTLREVALRNGIYATFMAKPMASEPGSAMHLHQSVLDTRTGLNVFSDEAGDETPLFRAYIAGCQQYAASAMLMFAPYVNSYRRIARYHAAPINQHWGYDNRTAGLRVPVSSPADRRVENRLAGADVNPYLAIAASLACGYLGMTRELVPTAPLTGSAYDGQITLPRSLFSALEKLLAEQDMHEVLGMRFVELYAGIKEAEFETFFEVISPWEREFLLLNV